MNKITKANFKKLVLVLTLTLVMTLGMSISVFAATGAINGYAITGSSHIIVAQLSRQKSEIFIMN